MSVKSTLSEVLDREFAEDLCAMSAIYHERQEAEDESKWDIALRVNDMWSEHKNLTREEMTDGFLQVVKVFPTRDDYNAECSRVLNIGRKRKLFSDSGETLKVWCNVVATFEEFLKRVPNADEYIDGFSFDHLRKAKRIYDNEKAPSPLHALDWATKNNASADEMQRHFMPASTPNEYEKATGDIDKMLTKDYWKWLKPEQMKEVLSLVKRIREIVSSAPQK